jgi:thioredoxin-dependent peroxiredoxin
MTKKKATRAKKAAKKVKKRAPSKHETTARKRAQPKKKAAPKKKTAPKKQTGATKAGDALLGKRAPRFELADQNGERVSESSLGGALYVLYFYPKDDTPGCTREACDFRDGLGAFRRIGVRVVGVSPDSTASHARFREKYSLPFTLLSDADKVLAKAYGAWVKKQNYGREYMGIQRSTFLVDARGVVRRAWRSVKVDGHVDQVLDAVRELG